jgi:hypothetical protein
MNRTDYNLDARRNIELRSQVCPTHHMDGLTISLEEMRDWVAKAAALGVCGDCKAYLERRIAMSKPLLSEADDAYTL